MDGGSAVTLAASLRGVRLRARLLNLGSGIAGQGTTAELRARCGIDAAAIVRAVRELRENEG